MNPLAAEGVQQKYKSETVLLDRRQSEKILLMQVSWLSITQPRDLTQHNLEELLNEILLTIALLIEPEVRCPIRLREINEDTHYMSHVPDQNSTWVSFQHSNIKMGSRNIELLDSILCRSLSKPTWGAHSALEAAMAVVYAVDFIPRIRSALTYGKDCMLSNHVVKLVKNHLCSLSFHPFHRARHSEIHWNV